MVITANELATLDVDAAIDDYHKSKIDCSRAMCAVGHGDWIYGGQWSSMNSWFRNAEQTRSITVPWKKARKKLNKLIALLD